MEELDLDGVKQKDIDINVLQYLCLYDQEHNTKKANAYIKIVKNGISYMDRVEQLENNKIYIHYNLRGIYDKGFPKEDRQRMLEMANNAKKLGIATVDKGLKVHMGELLDKTGKMLERVKDKLSHIGKKNDELKAGGTQLLDTSTKAFQDKMKERLAQHIDIDHEKAIRDANEQKQEHEQDKTMVK